MFLRLLDVDQNIIVLRDEWLSKAEGGGRVRVLGEASLSQREKLKIKDEIKENKFSVRLHFFQFYLQISPVSPTPHPLSWVGSSSLEGRALAALLSNVPQHRLSPLPASFLPQLRSFPDSSLAPEPLSVSTPGCRVTCKLCSPALGPLFSLPLSACQPVSAPF